jgi:hypothetical protein
MTDDGARVYAHDLGALARIALELGELHSPNHIADGTEPWRIETLETDRKFYMDEIERIEGRRPDLRATQT